MTPSLYIFGWGRVGSALGTQARRAGVPLVGVETRDPKRARQARRVVGAPNRPLHEAQLVVLAVPDGALEALAAAVAPRLRPGQIVFHLSGSRSLEPLQAVVGPGARPGSLHPFCSVASAATPLTGATCALDGSAQVRRALGALARAVGLRPLKRPPRDRIRYHLSAVLTVASAGVAVSAAEQLLREAGATADEARAALAAILRSVAFNIERDEPAAALTGPFARGDLNRIRAQLDVLKDPRALDLYRAVGRFSAKLSPKLTPTQRLAVERLLEAPPRQRRAR